MAIMTGPGIMGVALGVAIIFGAAVLVGAGEISGLAVPFACATLVARISGVT